jgi:predicted dehydrogenase
VGIVGAGEIARRAHLPVLANIADISIDWVFDHNVEKAIALGNAYGIRALHSLSPDQLPPCDVALLAIPVDVRGAYLQHFSRAGSAVLCEKPFALHEAEHTDFLKWFAPHSLGCGFMRRFYRSSNLMRRLVKSGEFGRLLKIDVSEGNRSKGSGVNSSFLDDPQLGVSRGVLMDLGSHSLDLALFISDAAAFNVLSCEIQRDGAVDRHVAANVVLTNAASPDDSPINLSYSVSWLERQTNRICLVFERSFVWSDLSPSGGVHLGDPRRPADCISLMQPSGGATTFNQAFYLQWCSFLEGLRSQRESLVSARSALLTTSLAEHLLKDGGSSV